MTKERPKLTPARRAVLDKMRAGAELGVRHQFHSGVRAREWVQQGGVGSGGDAVDVTIGTAAALLELGLIRLNWSDPCRMVYTAVKEPNPADREVSSP